MTIYKYPIRHERLNRVELPRGAKVISCQIQHGQICLWAMVDPSEEKEVRLFEVYGTGHEIIGHGPRTFINTVQEEGGYLIWHVFEYFGRLAAANAKL